jgi:hypothetical protein
VIYIPFNGILPCPAPRDGQIFAVKLEGFPGSGKKELLRFVGGGGPAGIPSYGMLDRNN